MTKNNDPYPQCASCKTLADCPHPDVEENLLGTPMCPDVCLKPIEVMKETLKLRKKNKKNNEVL